MVVGYEMIKGEYALVSWHTCPQCEKVYSCALLSGNYIKEAFVADSYECPNCLCTDIDISVVQEVSQERRNALITNPAKVFDGRGPDPGFGARQFTAERGDNLRCFDIAQNRKNDGFHPAPDAGKHVAELLSQGFVEYLVK